MINTRPKVALVLGGGGARGLAHIGVLKTFEKNNIPIDMIIGSSIGAIIGGAYALRPEAENLEKEITALLDNEDLKKLESLIAKDIENEKLIIFKKLATLVTDLYLWNLTAIKGCIADAVSIKKIIEKLVNKKAFDDTKIKFACVATDINNGEEVIFTEGELHEAIYASSALPGVFPPAKVNNKLLIDGGITNVLPADRAKKLGADLAIGVDVDDDIRPKEFEHGYDIMFRADDIRRYHLNCLKLKEADIIIQPDVKRFSWAHFSKSDEIIKKGEEAASNIMPKIKQEFSGFNLKSMIKNILNRK